MKDNLSSQTTKFIKYQTRRGFVSVWGIFEMKSWFDRPVTGEIKLRYHIYRLDQPPYIYSKVLKSPTYATLYREADALVQRSGDIHRIYIEGFKYVKTPEHKHLDYNYLDLICGS